MCNENMEKLESENCSEISNVIQGSAWKSPKNKFGNKIVIPFCIYHDDFDNQTTHVFFFASLCLLFGDNKTMNKLMGLTQCLIKVGFCRICSCTVKDSKIMIKEDSTKLQTLKIMLWRRL